MKKQKVPLLCLIFLFISGCATTGYRPEQKEAPVTKMQQTKAQQAAALPSTKRYKQKIAIIRFTNETNYGRALMTDADFDRLGKQASDMLASR